MAETRRLMAVILTGLVFAACGSNPMSSTGVTATGAQGTQLSGRFVPMTGVIGLTAADANPYAGFTVLVLDQNGVDTGIRVQVDSTGSFTLRGLPAGMFFVVFQDANGVEVGRIPFTEVQPNQQITVMVTLQNGSVMLVEDRRNGIGHGNVEVEGLVQTVTVNAGAGTTANDGTLMVNGYTIVSQSGTTSIRSGNRRLSLADIAVGSRVHVKGTWQTDANQVQQVLASEIKLQGSNGSGGNGTGDDGGTGTPNTCVIQGGVTGQSIQLEGNVATLTSADPVAGLNFTLQVNGNRASAPVTVTGGTLTCNGNKSTPCVLTATSKVHVRGTLTTCTTTDATVTATEVKVQK